MDHNAPAFELLLPCCAHMHSYLQNDQDNIVAVHCKAGKGRTGLIIVCYLLYGGLHCKAVTARKFYDTQRCHDLKGVYFVCVRVRGVCAPRESAILMSAASGAICDDLLNYRCSRACGQASLSSRRFVTHTISKAISGASSKGLLARFVRLILPPFRYYRLRCTTPRLK